MTDINIPPEALEAAVEAIRPLRHNPFITYSQLTRAAINAALAAWPDATMYGPHPSGHGPSRPQLVLPIQEARDE